MKMADWQTIISVLIVAGAFAYIGRRIYLRLRSIAKPAAEIRASCASGCSACGLSREGLECNNGTASADQDAQRLPRFNEQRQLGDRGTNRRLRDA